MFQRAMKRVRFFLIGLYAGGKPEAAVAAIGARMAERPIGRFPLRIEAAGDVAAADDEHLQRPTLLSHFALLQQRPVQWRAARHGPADLAAQGLRQVFGRQPHARADRAQILRREDRTRFEILHHIQRAAELQRLDFSC